MTTQQAMTAQRGGFCSRWGVVNETPHRLYPRERHSVPIVREVGWAPRLVWKCVENLSKNGMPQTAKLETIKLEEVNGK